MGGRLPLIALLVVAVIGQHVVSAIDCRESNCQFVALEECQDTQTVFCSMKKRPMKQINITATSFPRDVRDSKISDAEMITFEPDAISSLKSLNVIEITDVNTVILLPRSLARDSGAEQLQVTIRSVKTLQLHPETFHGWRGDSRITIDGVNDCQMQQRSMAGAQLRSLSLTNIQSLIVQESAFSADSMIETIYMRQMKYISLQERAFEAKVQWLLISDTENITIHSGALSRNARIPELSLEGMTYLNIESDGIEAEIDELSLKRVAMETCGENTFGGNVASLSLSSSYIHRTKKNCISAGHRMKKLTIENSHLNQTDASSIYGKVTDVQIKNSTFGAIGKEGLQLNVTKFSIEYSAIGEASEKAFVVLADSAITFRSCTFDVLQKGALSSLNVKQAYSTAHPRIRLSSLHLKRPQNGSLLFDQSQGITVNDVKTDIPCDCNITATLGLDMSSEHTFWINQPICVIKGVHPPLGHYLQEFCTEPTTTPPSTTPDELNVMKPRPDPETRIQTFGDGSDQVRTGSTHNVALIATITAAVLIVIAVSTFLVRRRFRRKSRQCADKGQPSLDTTLHPQSNQQTHETDSSPEISGPINSYVPEPVHITPYPTIIAETAETQYNYGAKPNKTWAGICRESQTVDSYWPTDPVGVLESNYETTNDTENVTGDTVHQEMTDLLDCPRSDVSAWTHTSCGPQQDGSRQNVRDVYLAPLDAKTRATANRVKAQYLRNNSDSGWSTMTVNTTVSHDELSQPLNERYNAPEWSADGPRQYIDIPIYYTAPRRVPEHRQTETRRRGGSQDEVSHRPDERYKLLASYRSDRPKDPRIQQLARDPRWARRYEKESEL